ncbi:short-subunit dehydrogenase [Humitalea rosea]|uniref:Short-subunit dehydrogenase n=1 Tax=Humitalea rosea TaxID=990373 RepID=A0A2W7IR64_9PROT|nr:SDR family NAD(P)-dependent oxidoreductase [Humitalea rosea]PZW41887.1 short-subunit dehydrogenase [Humitalea rosea]
MTHVVITGASRGLGAALALRFAAPGVRLGLIARSADGLAATAEACGAQGAEVAVAALDVRDAVALAAVLTEWGQVRPIDVAIANAGVSGGTSPDGRPEGLEAATRQIAVNLVGAMNLVEPLWPAMVARGQGRIALVASLAALRGLPDIPAYAASKAGLRAYGEALRAGLGPRGVKVTVLCPGFFESDMSRRFRGGQPGAVPLDQAAARCHAAILAGRGRLSFPAHLAFGMRLLDLLPVGLSDLVARRIRCRVVPDERA